MGAFGGAGGLHVRGHLFCVLARVRGELPGCGRDCARAGRIAERCGRCMLAWGASLRSGRNKIGGTLVRGCGKIYDSHLTCMEKPCIMIDKELLLFKYYILVKLINICYTHKEKRQWQKLEL